jgi:hypothetical protein
VHGNAQNPHTYIYQESDTDSLEILEVLKIEENNTEAKPEVKAVEPVVQASGSKGGIGGIIKTLVLVIIVAGITAGLVYQSAKVSVQGELEEKEQALAHAESVIKEKDSTISTLESRVSDVTVSSIEAGGSQLICSTCHGIDQTKSFHSVVNIKLLSESKGNTPRICTTCHGSSPHNVHKKKLDNGEMDCQSCHVSAEGDFVVPQVPEGKLLVCEACHAFSGKPEDVGNYVSIHVVEGNRECDICHMGNPIKIHQKATEKLGTIE